MMVRMLLKSWAMPPVNWPTASIFWLWRNAASACRRAVVSTASETTAVTWPSGSRSGRNEKSKLRVPVGSCSSSACRDGNPAAASVIASRTRSAAPGVPANQAEAQNGWPLTSDGAARIASSDATLASTMRPSGVSRIWCWKLDWNTACSRFSLRRSSAVRASTCCSSDSLLCRNDSSACLRSLMSRASV